MRYAALGLLLLAGCDEPAADPARATSRAGGASREAVVDQAIAALERELAAETPSATDDGGDDLEERVRGLITSFSSSNGAMQRLVLEELAQLGAPTVPVLAALLADRTAPADERRAAVHALAAADTPGAAEVLLARVESSRTEEQPEAWLIAQCAWRLGETEQEWVVPRLILCLRYEKEHETVLWLGKTLAHFGNLSGLDPIYVVATSGKDELRARAAGALNDVGAEAGVEHWSELLRAWKGEPGTTLDERPLSPRHRLEIWRQIRALSEWQLRGVDDGRFILSRESPGAATFLARALADRDRYIRVHSAQCLARMGPRALAAGPALVAALADPDVAHEAAAAIGGVHYVEGASALVERLANSHPLELRVAAARALGALGEAGDTGESAAVETLLGLLVETEPLDLRAAAAAALAAGAPLDRVAPAVRLLVELLDSPALEPTEPEAALELWLARLAETELDGAPQTYEGWRALHRGRAAERIGLRAALLREKLPQLLR